MYLQVITVLLATALLIDAAPAAYGSDSQSSEIQRNFRNQNDPIVSQHMRQLDDDYSRMKEETKRQYRNGSLTPQQYRDQMNAHRVDFLQREELIKTSAQRAATSSITA